MAFCQPRYTGKNRRSRRVAWYSSHFPRCQPMWPSPLTWTPFLVAACQRHGTNWRKYLDLEHATCYSDDNYWCALTDGKIKYIWRIHTGTEELFDLTQDPQELHNAVNDKKYRKQLTEMRNEMIRHLSERGEEFVKDGRLVVKEKTMLYGPHYPEKENKR